MIPLTNINPSDEIKNSCGIALVSIVMLSIFVNFFKFFKNISHGVRLYLMKKRYFRRLRELK